MSADFFNDYLEHTMNEVMELTKQKLAARAQLSQLEKIVQQQAATIEELQKALDKAGSKKKKDGDATSLDNF